MPSPNAAAPAARSCRALALAALFGLGAGLALPSAAQSQEKSFGEMVNKFVQLPAAVPESEMLGKASEAVNFIKRNELPQASKAINEALQLDARNSYLHFFNGFIYQLQARQGDAQKSEMAIEGYQQALRIDPGNWIAQEFLGLTFLDVKQYEQAKTQFSDVLLMHPESSASIYGLMAAAYMTGDPVTACAMADQFKKTVMAPHLAFIRSSIAVYASCGEFNKADEMRAAFAKVNTDQLDADNVERRLNQWKAVFRAQAALTDQGEAAAPPPAAVAAPEPPPVNDGTPGMVLVDVVMISTQELVTTVKGINLLHVLTLQLGSVSQAAFSRTFSSVATPDTVITRALTIPALAYSLNIANANNTLNEILARPTLAAVEGQPSEFFSGTNLNAAVVSTNSLGNASAVPVDKRFGVKLGVTPSFLPNGMVKLKVDAVRTFLNANSDSAGFAYRLDINETSVSANVVMKLGETLVLSGLSEKESSSSRSGVPVLQDVPVVQYLFSNKRTSDFQRSVLILLTPRAPVYTSRIEKGQSPLALANMKALREKFGFPARTPANLESVLGHMRTTNFFREFRQGDVSMERWDRMHSTADRLNQALGFLYY